MTHSRDIYTQSEVYKKSDLLKIANKIKPLQHFLNVTHDVLYFVYFSFVSVSNSFRFKINKTL